eukprot:6259206-Amphidinium_carterae.1
MLHPWFDSKAATERHNPAANIAGVWRLLKLPTLCKEMQSLNSEKRDQFTMLRRYLRENLVTGGTM